MNTSTACILATLAVFGPPAMIYVLIQAVGDFRPVMLGLLAFIAGIAASSIWLALYNRFTAG